MSRLTPPSSACSTCSNGSPAIGRMVVRGPATSSRAEATHSSVPVSSSAQPSSRSRMPFISGHESTATVSAPKLSTAADTLSSPPKTGTSAILGGLLAPARQAPTMDMP